MSLSTDPFQHTPSFQLDHFFELTHDLFCIAGYDGYFKKINPAVSKLLGYTEAELFERPIAEFIHPEDRHITAKNREQLTRNKPLLNFENRYVTKAGNIVWLSWTSMPVDNEQLVYAIAKDITYKKHLEEERNEQLTRLAATNQNLKQLSYTTSHDLRSPVNNLISVLQLLETDKIADDETREYVLMLKKVSENLSLVLNNSVSDLITSDTLYVELEEISFDDSLQRVMRSIDSLIRQSGAIVNSDFSPLPSVNFNKAYLDSIFLNLITNSIKYARPGADAVITINSQVSDGVKQLVVSDNGLGFDIEKVKDRLYGLHQKFHHHVDSKGVGLYLIYNHIVSLGGQIHLESEINKGATFTISFKD
ncbi:MAG: sensor histidine kinase [Sphingobacteriaceae bacterium]|jgi:PAS domain S-box-containing protein|nr:sensor histidine kinase [Sphingobacteriaceae bacterium]